MCSNKLNACSSLLTKHLQNLITVLVVAQKIKQTTFEQLANNGRSFSLWCTRPSTLLQLRTVDFNPAGLCFTVFYKRQ